jgi:MmoB/DmpM family protein
MTKLVGNDSVSAKLIGGEEAEVIAETMLESVEGLTVEDHGSYLSLDLDGGDLVFDMNQISEELGFPYSVTKFLAILTTYKGEIEVGDDAVFIRVFSPQN